MPETMTTLVRMDNLFFAKCMQLKMRYSPYVNKGFVEFYSTTIYIFMILEYNKVSRHNNQALQEHKMK